MPEIDYYEVLGVEKGEEVQEAADPVTTEEPEGVKEQEVTDPAGESDEADRTNVPERTSVPDDERTNVPKEHVQSDEDNAKYAAIRRRAEADAKKKYEAELDKAVADMGFDDPYTNTPIKSMADFNAYKERLRAEQVKDIQEKNQWSQEDYQRFVESLPEVQAGRAAMKKVENLEIQARMDRDLEEIRKINPDIRTMEDVAKLDNFQQLFDMVGKGYSLPDAYKVLNYDSLTTHAAQVAKQQALNSMGNKGHLQPSTARGQGAIPVPADIAAEYRLFMPDATDAEIQAHYNRYKGKD